MINKFLVQASSAAAFLLLTSLSAVAGPTIRQSSSYSGSWIQDGTYNSTTVVDVDDVADYEQGGISISGTLADFESINDAGLPAAPKDYEAKEVATDIDGATGQLDIEFYSVEGRITERIDITETVRGASYSADTEAKSHEVEIGNDNFDSKF